MQGPEQTRSKPQSVDQTMEFTLGQYLTPGKGGEGAVVWT